MLWIKHVLQVPDQLREAFLQAIAEGRVRSMQNKSMPAAPLHRPGALLLGAPLQPGFMVLASVTKPAFLPIHPLLEAEGGAGERRVGAGSSLFGSRL